MNASPDEILRAREARGDEIARARRPDGAVVSVRANVPGSDKEIPEAFLTIGFFLPLLPIEKRKPMEFLRGADGPTVLAIYDGIPPFILKKQLMNWENEHPIGRYVDLDVFGWEGPSLSRGNPRPCWICGAPVWECSRLHRHASADLLGCLRTGVLSHLKSETDALIAAALQDELRLDPKFGLVTPTDCGSHPDMDFELMERAGAAIRPYWVQMMIEGVFHPDPVSLFPRLQGLGLNAEKDMRQVTGGVNAYKGLIFNLGLVLGALGSLIGQGGRYSELPQTLRSLAAQVPWSSAGKLSTFGSRAWHEQGFGGIRREASAGFPALFHAVSRLETMDAPALTMALIGLIGDLEDSVLLKRAGSWETYREAKRRITAIRVYDPDRIRETTEWAKSMNLSFGGSADLLVCAAFLVRFSRLFAFGPQWDSRFRNIE
jgi:triphosphoribosyl-dephospho-CoA synthetase/phosphoribosyl-dephospho-CoA transferase